MTDTTPPVFIIVSYVAGEAVYRSNGTGFFVDNSGLFVSAGHVFNHEDNRTYKAIIARKQYLITWIWSEYIDWVDQKGNIYKDLYIGRVDGFSSTNFWTLAESVPLLELSPTTSSPAVISLNRVTLFLLLQRYQYHRYYKFTHSILK